MTSGNSNELSAAATQARECLHEATERLRAGDLLQAATSGWEAADGMASSPSEKQCSKRKSSLTTSIIPITILLEPISHQCD